MSRNREKEGEIEGLEARGEGPQTKFSQADWLLRHLASSVRFVVEVGGSTHWLRVTPYWYL